jgi:ankyrin repeat protein
MDSQECGYSALHWACSKGRSDCAALLVDAGCSMEMRNLVGGTPLMSAAYYGHAECVELLARAGADLDAVDGAGCSAPMWAVLGDRLDCLSSLCDAGCDLDLKCSAGRVALDYARGSGLASCAGIILAQMERKAMWWTTMVAQKDSHGMRL